jgi:hypothetical protein
VLFSYLFTISSVISRRFFGKPLPRERFTLGRYGLAVNVIAWLSIAPLAVLTV